MNKISGIGMEARGGAHNWLLTWVWCLIRATTQLIEKVRIFREEQQLVKNTSGIQDAFFWHYPYLLDLNDAPTVAC